MICLTVEFRHNGRARSSISSVISECRFYRIFFFNGQSGDGEILNISGYPEYHSKSVYKSLPRRITPHGKLSAIALKINNRLLTMWTRSLSTLLSILKSSKSLIESRGESGETRTSDRKLTAIFNEHSFEGANLLTSEVLENIIPLHSTEYYKACLKLLLI